jgi:hypothetical protein
MLDRTKQSSLFCWKHQSGRNFFYTDLGYRPLGHPEPDLQHHQEWQAPFSQSRPQAWWQTYKTFLSVTYEWAKKARAFIPNRRFQPSLMFGGGQEPAQEWSIIRVGYGFIHKSLIRLLGTNTGAPLLDRLLTLSVNIRQGLKHFPGGKHFSLFVLLLSYKDKSFITLTPGVNLIKNSIASWDLDKIS